MLKKSSVSVIVCLPTAHGGRWLGLAKTTTRREKTRKRKLRDSVEVFAWPNGQSLSIATVNGMVNEAASLAEGFRSGKVAKCPSVVMLDGIWLNGFSAILRTLPIPKRPGCG